MLRFTVVIVGNITANNLPCIEQNTNEANTNCHPYVSERWIPIHILRQ